MSAFSHADRSRLRAQAWSAGAIFFSTWPLKTFVAVNPLGGLEHRPFEAAVDAARGPLRLRGHLALSTFRAWHATGRITDADLDAALVRRLPELAALESVHLDGHAVAAGEALRADLLCGVEPREADAAPRGAAEACDQRLGTAVAPMVDEQVTKWCAAFFATHHARWAMPGRTGGLYRAWRSLVGADPALRRLGLSQTDFTALPERAEDAVLAALEALGVDGGERRAELRAQLARLPGWTSCVKWCAEHPGQATHPADLVDLLAIRLTYEAALVERAVATSGDGVQWRELPVGAADDGGITSTELADARRARAQAVAGALGAADADTEELAELAGVLERLPARDRGWVWLDAYEWHYRDELLTALSRPAPPAREGRADAQVVLCIDPRSEGLRRHLERRGAYDTFGVAGFFQLLIAFRALESTHEARLCPVPVTPTKVITERGTPGSEGDLARKIAATRHGDALVEAFHGAKDDLASPFALAEAAGWIAGPVAAVKTVAPRGFAALRARLRPGRAPVATELTVSTLDAGEAQALVAEGERRAIRALLAQPNLGEDACERRRLDALAGGDPALAAALELTPEAHAERTQAAARLGYDPEEQVFWAQFALRSLGLVDGFARVVVIAGHASHTENNAYEAALDCGACGGQHGGVNARVSCAMLNRPEVRAGLARRGIVVPDDTVFVAAEHDTATDEVTVLDSHAIPATHSPDVARLQADLDVAGRDLATERTARLPGGDSAHRRAHDWAQIRPEWGLARNAAFVVGPGAVTSGLDLQTRTFLHSYDARVDPDATVLETILTAPGLVVQWINAQYYFSTVDPEVLGAGDKTLHNVVGDVGVLEGHAGDLKLGLPWQSVGVGDELFHEPMRALYIVEAPRARVETLIARNDLLRHYFDGAWVSLVVREGPHAAWERRTPTGEWVTWTPAVPSSSPSSTQEPVA